MPGIEARSVTVVIMIATLSLSCGRSGNSGSDDEVSGFDQFGPAEVVEDRSLALGVSCYAKPFLGGFGPGYSKGYSYFASGTRETVAVLGRAARRCLEASTNCRELHACYPDTSSPSVCEGVEFGWVCEGELSASCFEGEVLSAVDCSTVGLQCNSNSSSADANRSGLCVEGSCEAAGFENYCEGDLVASCAFGGLRYTDCRNGYVGLPPDWIRALGGTCGRERTSGRVQCVGNGAACERDVFQNRCGGSVLTSCRGGYESSQDCNEFGQVCGHGAFGAFDCVADSECDPMGDEYCEDGVARFCSQGKKYQLDCRDHGFAGCDTWVRPGADRQVAYCVDKTLSPPQ